MLNGTGKVVTNLPEEKRLHITDLEIPIFYFRTLFNLFQDRKNIHITENMENRNVKEEFINLHTPTTWS